MFYAASNWCLGGRRGGHAEAIRIEFGSRNCLDNKDIFIWLVTKNAAEVFCNGEAVISFFLSVVSGTAQPTFKRI